MKTGQLSFLTLSLGILITYLGGTGSALTASAYTPDECAELAPLIRELRSTNQRKRQIAKKSILLFSSGSPESRQCVITALLRVFVAVPADPEGGFVLAIKSQESYAQWSEAADILGTMRATEAMDSLIDNLDFNNGKTSMGIGQYPAAIALVKFGDEAIPKLEKALGKESPDIRTLAVRALFVIGGEKAKAILEETLKMEKDEAVAITTRNVLIAWRSSGRRQP